MNDRGEKIVTLAREMLRADMLGRDSLQPKPALSLRVLCLTTMLAALGSTGVTEWFDDMRRPMNRYERTELNALVFYVAGVTGISENALRSDVQNQLSASSLNDLNQHDFRLALRYLQDQVGK